MCKVVIETWVEPGWECEYGCCWESPEQRWVVVEADIPWRSEYWDRICCDREYYRQWHEESYLFSDLLEGKVDEEVLNKVFQESEEPEVWFKKMLAELGVEVEIVYLDEGEENV
jgi:hypothetical protein